jgi:hypothetical protein
MKKQLQKIFYVFIVTAMLFSASANAQIVYTDVIPDSTMNCTVNFTPCTNNYNLDLNNDANNDFILTAYRYDAPQIGIETHSYVTADPLNGNAVKDTMVNSIYVAIPLQFNAVIDSNLLLNQSWQTSGSHILKYGIYGGSLVNDTVWGLWDSLSDYYLGLRILQSGQTHYGWVRLRVDVTPAHASLIVRDYAYNSIPNQLILAGQTVAAGINENSFATSINLFPNPASNQLTINNGKLTIKNVEIYDLTSREVYTENHYTLNANSEIKIDVSKFPAGIYVVQIQTADFSVTKKLVVEK